MVLSKRVYPVALGWIVSAPPAVLAAAAEVLPPLRSSDLGRPLGAGSVPVDAGNCGRLTDIVRLPLSNRSPRAPCPAGALASRMAMGWSSFPVAAATRPAGMPLLMTRLLRVTIVADAVVVL